MMGELKIVTLFNEHETSELEQHPIVGAMGVHLGDDQVFITELVLVQIPMVFSYRKEADGDYIDAKFLNAHYTYKVIDHLFDRRVYDCRVIEKRLI